MGCHIIFVIIVIVIIGSIINYKYYHNIQTSFGLGLDSRDICKSKEFPIILQQNKENKKGQALKIERYLTSLGGSGWIRVDRVLGLGIQAVHSGRQC